MTTAQGKRYTPPQLYVATPLDESAISVQYMSHHPNAWDSCCSIYESPSLAWDSCCRHSFSCRSPLLSLSRDESRTRDSVFSRARLPSRSVLVSHPSHHRHHAPSDQHSPRSRRVVSGSVIAEIASILARCLPRVQWFAPAPLRGDHIICPHVGALWFRSI